jgi:glyoxylase-like metal-dependent hydrolase (beta-lactamase superfamily II)
MLHFQTFIGGIFDTNAYLIQTPGGNILIDAPTGSSDWIRDLGVRLDLLVITHGHIDHFDDAAKIKRACKCQVAFHKDGISMMTKPDLPLKSIFAVYPFAFFLFLAIVPEAFVSIQPATRSCSMATSFLPGALAGQTSQEAIISC